MKPSERAMDKLFELERRRFAVRAALRMAGSGESAETIGRQLEHAGLRSRTCAVIVGSWMVVEQEGLL